VWVFGIWAFAIAVAIAWLGRSGLDGVTKFIVLVGVICGPYWVIWYNDLRKLPASKVFWRSTAVFVAGIVFGTLIYGLLTERRSSGNNDPECHSWGQVTDC
jgi:hypothetical protein